MGQGHRFAIGALVAGFLLTAPSAGADDEVMVEYRRANGEIESPQAPASLRIYADGRAVAHVPPPMTGAGDHESTIDGTDLAALIELLLDRGVLEFDEYAVRAAVADAEAAERSAGRLFEVSDPDETFLVLRLRGEERNIRWTGLQPAAARFPQIEPLVDLAAVERRLLGIFGRITGGGE